MKYLSPFKIFETNTTVDDILSDIEDILVEVNDLGDWKCSVRKNEVFDQVYFYNTNKRRFIPVVQVWCRTVDSDDEDYEDDCQTVPQIVEDIFIRVVDYMRGCGWTDFKTKLSSLDSHEPGQDIEVDEICGTDLYSNEIINITFKQTTSNSDSFDTKSWSEQDNKLSKNFEFKDFSSALDFINKISVICESENHHPVINWNYNKITLQLSTHDKGDIITDKDRRLASLIDKVSTQK